MKKSHIIPTITLMVLALVVSIGVSYVSAVWMDAVTGPPVNNIDVPVNASRNGQNKTAALSVNTFAALANGSLRQQALFKGTLNGIQPASTDPTLYVGGVATTGTTMHVTTTVNGDIYSGKTLGSTELANNNLSRICSDRTGRLSLNCGIPVVTPPAGSDPIYYASCFVADTMVTLANGTHKNIQDVKIGDVLKGDTTNNKVLAFHQPLLGDDKLYSFNGGDYFVTAEHPFLTTKGWKSIDPSKTKKENIGVTVTPLRVGDTVVTDKGLMKITTISSKSAKASTQLYNFILDGDHTYFADGYLVHNKQQAVSGARSCTPTGTLPCAIPATSDGEQLNPGTVGLSCTGSQVPSGGWGICPSGTSPRCSSSGIQLCD